MTNLMGQHSGGFQSGGGFNQSIIDDDLLGPRLQLVEQRLDQSWINGNGDDLNSNHETPNVENKRVAEMVNDLKEHSGQWEPDEHTE
ncbi:hypothetical protein WICPIJ_003425 [Wickerhamomyces pijperi]|uniref:Uncharacterized protein n=1 Tax=Wickerhamomyces pijperi TaxID=599730 RepID=A0A9P8TNW1_WICPI|nr:hypothetical protein WICPIJ_003425 [Wickerhamomyces pijperi]